MPGSLLPRNRARLLEGSMFPNRLQPTPESGPPIPGLIGNSTAMEAVYQLTRKVARTNASVLLMGETGTGKEMIATAIHRLSSRATGPFVKVNCGALSE